MHFGTFIGINKERRLIVGPNVKAKTLEEFMADTGIKDPKDVIGDFETQLLDRKEFHSVEDAVDELRLHEEAVESARREKVKLVVKLGGKPAEAEAAAQPQASQA